MDVRGEIYHVLNRANFRSRLFKTPAHYQDFLAIVEEGLTFVPMRILAYCLMPNHWHLVLQPRADGDLSKFLRRITLTHTQLERVTRQGRNRKYPVCSPAGQAVWIGKMGSQDRGRIRVGIHPSQPLAAQEGFLAPFPPKGVARILEQMQLKPSDADTYSSEHQHED